MLPRTITAFLYPAICIAIAITVAIAIAPEQTPDPATQAATTQEQSAFKSFLYQAATLSPALLFSAIALALVISPILYFASVGGSLLANYLKKKELEARNPEIVVQLNEARRLLEEKDQIIAQKDEEIKQLRERLGLNADDC